ncbi:MAG: ribosome small subunit-dependent GTPase A, partial [Flavobacteriaceae bacterium]|nr:ribosome small subunit-dependent GTPase A [Flavobacteriaceae bacterium]
TKIIESGIDIPNVNTIIINRANNFGLAELYQLRGRVGRTNKQAFCYLLVPEAKKMTKTAIQRLQAVEEFTDLGSGFKLSMRDMEIRGAGNLLGGEQSGYILEIGLEMYQKVLDEAVGELKEEEFSNLFEAKEKINIDKVKDAMIGKVTMFSGHSGVGKSTLINAIDPNLNLKTAEVSTQHKQGQHTTTFAEMFVIPTEPESYIIDTPGIKGFGVVDFEQQEIGDYFKEFIAIKDQCKFNNCLHVNEPKCAVKNALEKGEIASSRYRSYLQLLEGESEHYRTNNYIE